ncbi:MAG: metal-transporting ATPase, partial [Roseibium sp.]|nr:metal-transporting ATPase [Roseibium sp.]
FAVMNDTALKSYFGLQHQSQLQTVMFLQLVAGGHLLLLVTRTYKWFFEPPYPARPLALAIVLTQALAVLMCGFGWIVPEIAWATIGWIWVYLLVWLCVLGGVRVAMERLMDNRLSRRTRSAEIVNAHLHQHGHLHR